MPKLTWFGHSAVKMETNEGLIVYIDPWVEKNPVHPTNELPDKADVILVTHDHFDHVADVVALANKTGAQVIAQPETIAKFVSEGLSQDKGTGMNIGGTVRFNNFQAKMVQAFHSANTGAPAGYVMNIDGKIVYHLGDTGLFGDLKLIGELNDIDYALIPVGGHFTMDHKDGAIAAKFLQAKNVMPIHYKTFPLLLQNAEEFVQEVERVSPQTKVIVQNIGEELDI